MRSIVIDHPAEHANDEGEESSHEHSNAVQQEAAEGTLLVPAVIGIVEHVGAQATFKIVTSFRHGHSRLRHRLVVSQGLSASVFFGPDSEVDNGVDDVSVFVGGRAKVDDTHAIPHERFVLGHHRHLDGHSSATG